MLKKVSIVAIIFITLVVLMNICSICFIKESNVIFLLCDINIDIRTYIDLSEFKCIYDI